jgi:hypothetical protein
VTAAVAGMAASAQLVMDSPAWVAAQSAISSEVMCGPLAGKQQRQLRQQQESLVGGAKAATAVTASAVVGVAVQHSLQQTVLRGLLPS